MRSSWSVAAVVAGFLVGLGSVAGEPSVPVAPPAPLRYAWQPGATLVYAVEIEVDHGDEVETQKGVVSLTVTAVDDGQAVLSMPPLDLVSQRRLKPGRRPLVPSLGPPVVRPPVLGPPGMAPFNGHEVRMDGRGRIAAERGDAQLPFALGAPISLVFQPFPEGAEARWQRTGDSVIRVTADWPLHSPFRQDVETGRHNAEEVTAFEVRAADDARVEIARSYSLKSVQTVEGEPVMELTGSGTIVLDRRRGLPTEARHVLRFTERDENREQRFPIRFTCTLMDEAELAKQKEQAEAARAAAAAAMAARRAPPTAPERETLLADMKSKDKERARRAMNTLQHKRPEAPDSAVAEAIAEWLESDDMFIRQQAAEALANWGTPAVAPALLKLAEGNGFDARVAARALGSLKERRAAPLLAGRLTDMSWRFEASQALKAIGTPAEGPVAKALKDKDWGVRLEACRILQEIGTKDSLRGLDAVAAEDENPLVKQTATMAAQAIRQR